jgi:hypothetical protein
MALEDGRPYPTAIKEVTEKGLRTAGAWPNPEDVLSLVADLLNQMARKVETDQPEQAGKLRSAAQFLLGAGKQVGLGLVTQLLAHLSHL